jgi:hypothetical protein
MRLLGAAYLDIAERGNQRIDPDLDRLEDEDRDRLAPAVRDLRDAAAAETDFDLALAAMTFPAGPEATAQLLLTVNQNRIELTRQAAASTTLTQLRGYDDRLDAANDTLERYVRTLRAQLGLPPPDPS